MQQSLTEGESGQKASSCGRAIPAVMAQVGAHCGRSKGIAAASRPRRAVAAPSIGRVSGLEITRLAMPLDRISKTGTGSRESVGHGTTVGLAVLSGLSGLGPTAGEISGRSREVCTAAISCGASGPIGQNTATDAAIAAIRGALGGSESSPAS